MGLYVVIQLPQVTVLQLLEDLVCWHVQRRSKSVVSIRLFSLLTSLLLFALRLLEQKIVGAVGV